MALVLNEEQMMLRESARGFLNEKAPVSALRELRDNEDTHGYSRELWAEMVNMGFAGIVIPEEYGGIGYGYVGAGIVMEEMGRTLTASPFFSTSVVSATLLNHAGSEDQKQAVLTKIAAGEAIVALAVDEGAHHNPAATALKAEASGNGYKLNGAKAFVLDGHVADQLIVAARTSGDAGDVDGISLFLVDAKSKGIGGERTIMADSRNAASIAFDDVQVDGDALIGTLGAGHGALEVALNAGRACLAAELSGTSQQSFEMTVDYLKERQQFGVPIGSFQALQHRAAHLFTEIELAKSVVLKALQSLDNDLEKAGPIASLAKAKLAEVSKLATAEAVQMFGGYGFIHDYPVEWMFRDAKLAQIGGGTSEIQRLIISKLI